MDQTSEEYYKLKTKFTKRYNNLMTVATDDEAQPIDDEDNVSDEDDIMRDPVKRERYAPMPEDRLYPPGENPEEKK